MLVYYSLCSKATYNLERSEYIASRILRTVMLLHIFLLFLFLVKNYHLCSQEGKDLSTVEHPFDDITYNIPEKPVTFTEGASYSLVILAGLGIAGLAGYAVFKELIFEPKE